MGITLLSESTKINTSLSEGVYLTLLIVGIILLSLLVIATLYGIAGLRRKNIVLKKVDYFIEDITYKSESLNVTVETLNKISNYALSLDAVSEKGFKSAIKVISENRNYIYSIFDKMRTDVEERERTIKKPIKKDSKTEEKKILEKEIKTSEKITKTIKKPIKKDIEK